MRTYYAIFHLIFIVNVAGTFWDDIRGGSSSTSSGSTSSGSTSSDSTNKPFIFVKGLLDSLSTSQNENECSSTNGSTTCSSSSSSSSCTADPISFAEMRIRQFLSHDDDDEVDESTSISTSTSILDKFHFHGWRWHTLSIIRDSSRLHNFANKQLLSQPNNNNNNNHNQKQNDKMTQSQLHKAIDHVIDFNLKGLQRIENNVFYPWLKEKLISTDYYDHDNSNSHENNHENSHEDVSLKEAFQQVIDGIERDKEQVVNLANMLRSQGKQVISNNDNNTNNNNNKDNTSIQQQATIQISQTSQQLSNLLTNIYDKEVTYLVPAIAKIVPAKEQIKVNNKILRNLGIFESRAILVGMYETLTDDRYGSDNERMLFEREIPYIPRKMIPRWKRTLYEAQAGMLE